VALACLEGAASHSLANIFADKQHKHAPIADFPAALFFT
jgi:hypothetical protein